MPPISANMHCYMANCLAPLCLLTCSQNTKEENSTNWSTSCACKSLLMAHSRHHQAAFVSTITAHCCLIRGCLTLFFNSMRNYHYNIPGGWCAVFLSIEIEKWHVVFKSKRIPLKFRINLFICPKADRLLNMMINNFLTLKPKTNVESCVDVQPGEPSFLSRNKGDLQTHATFVSSLI